MYGVPGDEIVPGGTAGTEPRLAGGATLPAETEGDEELGTVAGMNGAGAENTRPPAPVAARSW